MVTIRIAEAPLQAHPPLTQEQLRDALRHALETALHTQRRDLEEFRTADASGALRRFDDPAVALVEIMWRCWIARQRFSGVEDDVIRSLHAAYAFVAPEDGPDRRDEARLGLLQWADPSFIGVELEPSPPPEDSSPTSSQQEPTGLPWPWHRRGAAGSQIRDALGADDRVALDLLAEAAARGDAIAGVSTLLAGADLPASQPTRSIARGTDHVRHFQRLIGAYMKVATGAVVSPGEEIALALEDLPDRPRAIVQRRMGIGNGTPEALREIGESMGISGERARQLFVSATARCEATHPLLPICMAAWRAFPHNRVAASLDDWWAALPREIRPPAPTDLTVLRAAEDWYWFPRAAWVKCDKTWMVSVTATASTLERTVATVAASLRSYRRWGAVSVRALAEAAQVSADVARSIALASSEWEQVLPDWFIHPGEHTALAAVLGRWMDLAPHERRRRLKTLVRRRQRAGKPAIAPPAAVVAAFKPWQREGSPRHRARPITSDVTGSVSPPTQSERMPMPNVLPFDPLNLTGAQARYVVGMLVRDGRLGEDEIARYLAMMAEEIRALETRLAMLRGSLEAGEPDAAGRIAATLPASIPAPPPAPASLRPPDDARLLDTPAIVPHANETVARRPADAEGEGAAAGPGNGTRRRRRRVSLTPETLASRRLQGQYLNLIRQMPAERRDSYKAVAREQGREAAIQAMEEALGRAE